MNRLNAFTRWGIAVLLTVLYAVATTGLFQWGSIDGPNQVFRLVWILTLLAYAFAQTGLKDTAGKGTRERLILVLRFICSGSLIGLFLSFFMLSFFDRTGISSFVGLITGLGLCCGLVSLILGLLTKFKPPSENRERV